jgi:hypothetical protein
MVSTMAAVGSALAAIVGVSYSAHTFKKSFSKMSQSEQVRIVHDINNNLALAEDAVIQAWDKEDPDEIKLRHMQYLNIWEWYSFLVNRDQITIQELVQYNKKSICEDYRMIFELYPDLKEDNESYKEFKELYRKLNCENN